MKVTMSIHILRCVECREDFSTKDRSVYCDHCKMAFTKKRNDKKKVLDDLAYKEGLSTYGVIGQQQMLKRIKLLLKGCDKNIELSDVISIINEIEPDDGSD